MAKGKRTCKILKEIRRQIAAANGIDLIIEECRYKGDCLGTCPRCEAEVRYLEEQLRERRLSGRAVALAGVSAGMLLMAGCTSSSNRTTNVQPEVIATQQVIMDPIDDYDASEIEDDNIVEGEPCVDEYIITQGEDVVATDEYDMIVTSGEINLDDYHDDGIYEAVEEMPKFPGGDEALMDYMKQHLKYPRLAAENGIQGLVVVKFVVKKDGSIGDIQIVKRRDPDLEEEAVRLVRELPNFTPGRMNGEPVDVWFTIPVRFKLPPAD